MNGRWWLRAAGGRLGAAVVAAVVAALAMVAEPAAAAGGDAYVLSDVQCDVNHNGVLDLTLVNERLSQAATFVVSEAQGVAPASIAVAAASVSAITFADLADGALVVPVSVDGVDNAVAVRVACDAPEVAVMGEPVVAPAVTELPSTGSSATGGVVIGSILVAAGIAASLLSRHRYS